MLYGEYDSTGALVKEYVYVNGEPIAQVDAGSPETVLYLHTDHLATPRYATNTSGTTVWIWDSGAFGAESPTGIATINLRFPGQYFDSETTLHYNWNRYYDPSTGRYISSDPIGLGGGLNTYLYVNANPLVSIDPEGLDLQQMSKVILIVRVFTKLNHPFDFKVDDLPGDSLGYHDPITHTITYDIRYEENKLNCVALEEFFALAVHEAIHFEEHKFLDFGPDKKIFVMGRDDPDHKWVYETSAGWLDAAKNQGIFTRFFPDECKCRGCQ